MSDDFLASSSTSGRISAGESRNGNIEAYLDKDWFAISLIAGSRYTFSLDSAATNGLSDPYLRLLNASGSLIIQDDDSGPGINSLISYSATASGTYYLEAGGYSYSVGSYVLTAALAGSQDDYSATTSTAGRLSPGTSVSGQIEISGDNDWFAINLQAGSRYTFDLNRSATGGLGDPYLSLYNASGTLLTANDDSNGLDSQISYTAATSGVYYLGARGYGSETGAYTLSASSGTLSDDYAGSAATSGQLALNSQIKAQIETASDHDWFSISLNAGQQYVFTLDPDDTNGLSDPYLRLYSSSGILITEDDDSGPGYASRIAYTPSQSGTFYLDAAGYGSTTGRYTIAGSNVAQSDDYLDTGSTAGRVTPGGSAVSGNIETTGDSDWFAVNLLAGSRYTFNLNAGSTNGLDDPYLSLYSSSGTLLITNDDHNGLNSEISYSVVTSGTYYLGATGYGSSTGTYAISASGGSASDDFAGSTATAGRLSAGASSQGNIETAGDHDWFAISLVAGSRYTFSLNQSGTAGLSDTYLRLYSGTGVQLAENDNFNGANSQITYTATTNGTYYLGASGYGGTAGTYVLSASSGTSSDDYAATTATVGRLTVGGSTTGNIEAAGDNDWFAITLTAGTNYTFNLNSGANGGLGDTYLSLYNAGGTLITANDDTNGLNSQITYTATTSGTYFLDARGYSDNTGTYTLISSAGSVSDDFAANTGTAGRLTVGSSTTGDIEAINDHDWFAVNLTAGTNYRFNLNPGTGDRLTDPYMQLFNGTGTLLASNDDANGGGASQIDFQPTTSGTYYIDASGYGSSTGNYALSATTLAGASPTSGFNIEIVFSGESQYQSYFTEAAARWAQIITNDLPDVGSIDDLRITASVQSIDGVGNILAQAGATGLRSGSSLPYSGQMRFDNADAASLVAKGTFGATVLHEMGHVLGISSYFFDRLGLVEPGEPTHYIGSNALAQYRTINSTLAAYVPVENGGGPGTAHSHWEEDIFNTELMTGYVENAPPMPVSIVTIGALQDLGYQVNYAAADSFSL